MRVENMEDDRYVKKPDRIEMYLIRIVNRFFDTETANIKSSRESIILEALKRFKEDGLAIRGSEVRREAVTVPAQGQTSITIQDRNLKEGSVVNASFSQTLPAGLIASLASVDGKNKTFTINIFNASNGAKSLPAFTLQYAILNR